MQKKTLSYSVFFYFAYGIGVGIGSVDAIDPPD